MSQTRKRKPRHRMFSGSLSGLAGLGCFSPLGADGCLEKAHPPKGLSVQAGLEAVSWMLDELVTVRQSPTSRSHSAVCDFWGPGRGRRQPWFSAAPLTCPLSLILSLPALFLPGHRLMLLFHRVPFSRGASLDLLFGRAGLTWEEK